MEAISEEVDSHIDNSNEIQILDGMVLHQQLIKRIDELNREITFKEDKLRKLNTLEAENSIIGTFTFQLAQFELNHVVRKAVEDLFVDVCRNTVE